MGAGGGSGVAGSAATLGAAVAASSALGPRMRLTTNTTSPIKPRMSTMPVHRGLSDEGFTAEGRVRRAVVSSAMEPRPARCGAASVALATGRGDGRGFDGGASSAGPCSTTFRFSGD
jgi:hypothetical protein